MSKKTRRHHTPDQKINLLRRHHLEKVPVSEVCEGAELQPSVFYGWQRHLFEHGSAAFGESRKRAESSREAGAARGERAAQGPPGAQGRGHRRGDRGAHPHKKSVGEP
jgi:transposase